MTGKIIQFPVKRKGYDFTCPSCGKKSVFLMFDYNQNYKDDWTEEEDGNCSMFSPETDIAVEPYHSIDICQNCETVFSW